jgi:hypothetical protein
MATLNFTVGKQSKKMTPNTTKLGTVGDVAGNSLVFTLDEHINGYGVLEVIKPTAVSTNPEQTFKYALTNTGSSYTWTVNTALLDINCIAKLRIHIESNDIEVFKSNLCYMYIDGNVQAEIDSLEDDVSTLGSTVDGHTTLISGLETRAEAIEAELSNNWEEWTPVLTWADADPVTPDVVARFAKMGNICHFEIQITSTDCNATTGLTISLPVSRAETGLKNVMYSAINSCPTLAYIEDSDNLIKFVGFATHADGDPIAIYVSGTYEVGSDLTAYRAALAAVTESDYTSGSWTTYQLVVTDNVVTTADTPADITIATGLITAAQADLVFAGQEALDAAIAAEALLVPENYVDYSAVTAALALPETTNAEVVAKTSAITDAIAGLTEA